MRTITVTDEQFARLQALAEIYHTAPEQILSAWIDALLAPAHDASHSATDVLSMAEYDRRWKAFMRLVGSIQQGKLLTNEEIDELIGEEATHTHE